METDNWIKGSIIYAIKDKVWVIAALLMVVIGFIDIFSDKSFKGGILFFSVIYVSAIINIGYLKWLFKKINNNF